MTAWTLKRWVAKLASYRGNIGTLFSSARFNGKIFIRIFFLSIAFIKFFSRLEVVSLPKVSKFFYRQFSLYRNVIKRLKIARTLMKWSQYLEFCDTGITQTVETTANNVEKFNYAVSWPFAAKLQIPKTVLRFISVL